ncbi:MAG: trypsin-like peptidase domain-containing protein [Chloroflexota bacterium]
MSRNSNSSRLVSLVLGAILFLLVGVILGALFAPNFSQQLITQFQTVATLEPIQNTETEILSEPVVVEPTETSEVAVPSPTTVTEEAVGDIEAEIDGTPITPAIVAPASLGLQTGDLQERLISIYKETNPAVVHIFALVQNVPLGTGTGFVIDGNGHILTNNHVIAGADDLEIKFPNGFRTKAEIIGTDEDADVAVIRVNQLPEGTPFLPLGDSSNLQVGEFVVAIGNPFGQDSSMSLGIVSAVGRGLPSDRQLPNGGSYQLPDAIQIDAPINPGNSGGPLLNLAGEVVGINARIFSQTGANSGVGFSIPIDIVERMIPSLIETGRFVYPFVGVSVQSDFGLEAAEQFGLDRTTGAYVTSLVEGGPAERAGFQAATLENPTAGDLIIGINGNSINTFEDMISYLYLNTSPGDSITVTVLRDGAEVDLELTLDERP